MGKMFSLDSPVMQFLSKMADLMILNLLTLALCIPVITGGAAITALNYMTMKIARGEESYIVKGYFKSFRENFRQATVIWLMELAVIALIVGDFFILRFTTIKFGGVLTVMVGIVAIICLLTVLYVYAVLSRFENTIKNTLKNSLLMSIMNLPRTILILLINLVSPLLLIFSTQFVPIWFALGISVPTYMCSLQFSKIFKKYEPEEEETANEENLAPLSFIVEEQEQKQRELEAAQAAAAAEEAAGTAENDSDK